MANKNKCRSWHCVQAHGSRTGATTAWITCDTSLHAWKGLCRIRSVARQDKNVTAGWRCSILSASSEPATSAQAKFKIPPAIVCSHQCKNDARTFPNSVHLFIGKEKVEGFDVIDSLHDCPSGRCLPRCCVRCSLCLAQSMLHTFPVKKNNNKEKTCCNGRRLAYRGTTKSHEHAPLCTYVRQPLGLVGPHELNGLSEHQDREDSKRTFSSNQRKNES